MMRGRTRTFASAVAVAAIAAACVFAAVQAAVAERTIALSSGTVQLSLAQGGTAKESLKVANNGDEPLKALIYASDVKYKADGSPDYVKPTGAAGDILKSPATWLTLRLPKNTQVIANTPYIELKPREEITLDFEMNVPGTATPGDYNSVIFFEMFETDGEGANASSKVAGRIGARIVVRVAGDVLDQMDLAPYAVRNFVIGDAVPYSFTLSNKGNIDKRYQPYLVVLDTNESERMRSLVETNSIIYAQNSREYSGTLKLKNAAFGKYVVRAEVAYDKETGTEPGNTLPEKLAKDRTIYVIPVWFAILAVVVVALPLLWLSYRASVRGRRKGAHSTVRHNGRAVSERAAAREARAAQRGDTGGESAHANLMREEDDVDY